MTIPLRFRNQCIGVAAALTPFVLALVVFQPAPAAAQAPGTIAGQVTEAQTGEPLVAAEVNLVGTQRRVVTDQRGNFIFTQVQPGEHQVRVHSIGYRAATQTVQVRAGEVSRANFNLAVSAVALDEIVVTGQAAGTARREIGTSIATIDVAALEDMPIQNVSQMLQSRAPGVTVMTGGGKAGQGGRILLRGVGSLSQDIQPIIYVDGVRVDNAAITGVGTGGAASSTIDDINPDDIERIEIIRGAAAATMYGTEASAGVIQIFTRQGRGGTQRWTYRSELGQSSVPRDHWDVSVYSDWFADNIARTGQLSNQRLAVDGQVDGFSYSASGNYRQEQGVLPNSYLNFGSFRGNMRFTPAENFSVSVNTGFSRRRVDHPQDGNNTLSWTMNGLGGGPLGTFYPMNVGLDAVDVFQTFNVFTGGATAEWTPLENFTHRLTFGVNLVNQDDMSLREYGTPWSTEGYTYNYWRKARTTNVDYATTYRFDLTPNIRSGTSFGFQAYDREDGRQRVTGTNFPGPGVRSVRAAGSASSWEWRQVTRSAGFFGEQQLGFNDLFFVTVGARADGHSAFGQEAGYAFYPKIDASYVVHEHGFFPEFVNSFRLRAAYGTAGQQPGAFDAERTWTPIRAMEGIPALTTSNIGNPTLTAEISHETEFGLDMGLIDDRIGVEYTHYRQQTRDALFNVRYPYSVGFLATQLQNVGEVQNIGHELALRVTPYEAQNLVWNVRGSVSRNDNLVLDLGGQAPLAVTGWSQWIREGYPVGAYFEDYFVIPDDGDPILASEYYIIRDEQGNPLLDHLGEPLREEGWDYIGPAFPVLNLTLGTDVRVGRALTFNVLIDHKGGHFISSSESRWLTTWMTHQNDPLYEETGDPRLAPGLPVANICNPDGTDADGEPIITDTRNRLRCTVHWSTNRGDHIYPADITRLREVSVAYRLPRGIVDRLPVTGATVSLAGRNLWRHMPGYPFLEAEANYNTGALFSQQAYFDTPLPRQWVATVNVNF